MFKQFNRCYKTIYSQTHTYDQIAIETDGVVNDWYPKLYNENNVFVIQHNYGTNDYITELVVWDADDTVYHRHDRDYLIKHGAYIKYVRNNQYPNGMWFGQYPHNAFHCNGLFVKRINEICEMIRKNPEYHMISHDGVGDLLSAVLFPDHVVHVDQDVNAAIIPQKKQAIKAIDDAITAFEIINQLNLTSIYGNVPEEYYQATNKIIKRLANARMWIDSSTIKVDSTVD